MEEREFEQRAAEAWKHVLDLFEGFDPDDADVEQAGDVIRIDYRDGSRVVLNTQRPARQLWLAGGATAWHLETLRGLLINCFSPEDSWTTDRGSPQLLSMFSIEDCL